MDTLTTVMKSFQAAFTSGVVNITPMAKGLWSSLLLIDFVWTMSKAAMQEGSNYLKIFVEKTLRYMIFLYLISHYDQIFHALINSMIKVGLTAGGSTLSASNFADPSLLINKGFSVVEPIEKFFLEANPLATSMIGTLLLLAIIYLLIIAAFFIMAIQVFITYLEVYIVGTLALFFLGCGVNKHTSFLAEKSIGAVLSFAMKLMTLAFILSVAQPLLNGVIVPGKATLFNYLNLLAGVAAIAFLCWQAPSLAAGLMAGSPSLSAGGVAGAVMSTGAAAIGGVMAGMGGMNMIKRLAGMAGGGGATGGGQLASEVIRATSAAGGGLTSQDGVFNTGQYSGAGASTPSSSGAPAGGMKAEDVAARIRPPGDATVPGNGGGTTTSAPGAGEGGAGASTTATGAGESGATGSVPGSAAGGTEANSTATGGGGSGTGSTGASPGAGGQASAPTKKPSFTAADVAGRLALAQNMIAPESAPQGGIGAVLQKDDD